MEDVDLLIGATRAGGGAVDLDLIGLCLTVAIDHGNTLFQNNDIDGCAVLHHHTAGRVLGLLAGLEQSGGRLTPALRHVRGELAAVVASYSRVTVANARTVAWELYEAFVRIIQLPPTPPDDADRRAAGEYHGFISYRRDGGADVALAVRAHLQMRRLNTFLDVDELATGVFGPQLLRAIERAPSFLLILSPKSLDRVQERGDWLRAEIAHAIRTERTIIPIVMDGFHFPDATALPPEIRAVLDHNAVTHSREYFGAVIDRIERFMRAAGR